MDDIDKELKKINVITVKQLNVEKQRFAKEIKKYDISDIVISESEKPKKMSFFKKIFKFL